jgi:pilus assembly protein FimV
MGSVGAISLGNISLLSKPGERLLAELEVKDISPVESNDLQASLAAPELYNVARVTMSPELALIKAQLKRKPDGSAFIEFSSEQPLTSPSLDMLIEFRWATGRRVFMGNVPTQSATSVAAASAAAPNLPVVTPTPAAPPAPAAPAAPVATPAPPDVTATAPAPAPPAAADKPADMPAPAVRPSSPDQAKSLTVVRGDTASELALRHKDSQVSLDQMLVALLRANPDAFIENNVNRLKAGAVLKLPDAQEAQQTTASEARQTIKAQAADFAQYRAKLAANAPNADLPKAGRSAQGSLQGQVKDGKAQPGQDKLTLGKADSAAAKAADKVAAQKQAEQTADEARKASQNVADLNALAQAASGLAATPAPVSLPSQSEVSVIDTLVDHPWTPYGAAGLVVLLALLGWIRSRRAADDLIDDDIYTAPAREREPAHDPAPSSPFNFDLELEASPKSAPTNTSATENLAAHDGAELGDAPPPSDYEVRLNLAEELWDMGQHNTARALAEEVVREASGDIQRKAQRWLNQHQA